MISITEKEYVDLIVDSEKLSLLEGAGVDNWEGYSEALFPDEYKGESSVMEEFRVATETKVKELVAKQAGGKSDAT